MMKYTSKSDGITNQRVLLVTLMLLALSIGGCDDESALPQDTTETSDATERNFPLPEGWTPVAPDAMDEYGGLNDSDDLTQFNDPATLEQLREDYEKCDVAIDEQGHLRGRCSEDVVLSFANPCPRGRFVLIAHPALDIPESEWSYCLQDDFDWSIRNCRKNDCSEGYVCEGTLRDATSDSRYDELAFCVQPSRCLAVAEATEFEGEAACFYDDLTFAETGEIEEQDCSQLEPGECSVNCPCADSVDRCRFLSETRPVGMCASEVCGDGSDAQCTTFDLGGCVHLAEPPEWSEDVWPGDDAGEVLRGQCATEERCENLQERYPGVYNCAYGDD